MTDRLSATIFDTLNARPDGAHLRQVIIEQYAGGYPTVALTDHYPTGARSTHYSFDPVLAHHAGPDQALAMIINLLTVRLAD